MTRAEAKSIDDFRHTCLYYPYQPPDAPNWCYKYGQQAKSIAPPRPKFSAYLGLQGLRKPSTVSGRRYQQDLHWTHPKTGKVVKLRYDVHHGTSPVFSLDESEVVLGVTCRKQWMTLHISPNHVSSILQELLPSTILTGGREWRCLGPQGEVRSILHRILEVEPEADGLLLKTEAASISDVFQDANVSLRVAAFPPGHIHEHAWAGGRKLRQTQEADGQAMRLAAPVMVGGFWDAICGALKFAWHVVTGVARAVEKVVDDIGRVAKAIATGDFSYEKHFDLASMSWNYDPSTQQVRNKSVGLGGGVSCQECFFEVEASINFDLQIKSYKVDHAAVWMEGDAQVLLDAEFASLNAVDEFHLATVHLDEICTTIAAIPFCLDATMIVDVGFNVTGDSSTGSNHARLSASGHIKKGLLYQDNGVHRIDVGSLEPLSDSHFVDVKASQYWGLNLFPKLVLTVDHIGGPIVGIKATLEAITEVSSQECSGPGIYGALNLGLQFSVGGFLSIKIPVAGVEVWTKNFPSLLSLSHTFPIVSGCHVLSKSGRMFEMEGTQPLKNGVVFSGTIPPISGGAPWCAGAPPLLVAYQVSNFAENNGDCDLGGVKRCPQVVRGQSSRWNVPAGEMGETELQAFNPFAYGQEELATTGRTFAPMTQDMYIKYEQTSEEGKGLPAITYNVEVSSDLSSMTLKPVNSGSCYSEATLYRSAKAAAARQSAKQSAKQSSVVIWQRLFRLALSADWALEWPKERKRPNLGSFVGCLRNLLHFSG